MLLDTLNSFDVYKGREGEGWQCYVSKVMAQFPTFLHSLYRYSINVLGDNANTKSIIDLMNCRAKILNPECPIYSNLGISTYHFWKFFHMCNGKLIQSTTKPGLTPEIKANRKEWAKRMKELIKVLGDDFQVCFIDEKLFYTTSRRTFFLTQSRL